MAKQMTHKEFMKTNSIFNDACAASGFEATKRQAAKFRRAQGCVWKFLVNARRKAE